MSERVNSRSMEEPRVDAKRQRTDCNDGEDWISGLPDNLILAILSTVPTEDAIRTGILSRRWKNLWKEMTELVFDKKLHKQAFSNHVVSALLSQGNYYLGGLKIIVDKQCEELDLGIWTAIACARKVSKLIIRLDEVIDPPIFPASILGHPNTLKILKLVGNLKLNIPIACVCLKSLKELHLYHSRFEDAESLGHLLLGCPNLEELVIDLYISSGVEIFTIAMNSLKRLTLGSYNCGEESLVIEAPCLKYLNIRSFDGVISCSVGETIEIDDVNIAVHDENMEEDILKSITSAIVLSVCAPLKFPSGKIFWRLTSLELSTNGWNWCYMLSCFLLSSPKLEDLKLIGGFFSRISRTWQEPEIMPGCLVDSLKTLEWSKYIWDGEDDIDAATYILKYAVHLQKATFISSKPHTIELQAQRTRRISQLASVTTASMSCTVLFVDRAFYEYPQLSNQDSDLKGFKN